MECLPLVLVLSELNPQIFQGEGGAMEVPGVYSEIAMVICD